MNEAERARLQNTVDVIKQRRHLIRADFEVALQLATELDFLFEKGNFEERRLLCETVFKRVYLKDGKISQVELNAPFGLIGNALTVRKLSKMAGEEGFEPSLTDPESAVLPLDDSPAHQIIARAVPVINKRII